MPHLNEPRTVALALAAILLAAACADGPPTEPTPAVEDARELRQSLEPQKITHATARSTICEFALGDEREINGVVHFTGRTAVTRAESDDPRYTGENDVTFRGWMDADGDGRGFGRFTFTPDEIDGAWEGTFTGGWKAGLFSGRAVARGTGDLQAQTLHFQIEEKRLGAEHPDHTCSPALPGGPQFRHTLRIIDPAG